MERQKKIPDNEGQLCWIDVDKDDPSDLLNLSLKALSAIWRRLSVSWFSTPGKDMDIDPDPAPLWAPPDNPPPLTSYLRMGRLQSFKRTVSEK